MNGEFIPRSLSLMPKRETYRGLNMSMDFIAYIKIPGRTESKMQSCWHIVDAGVMVLTYRTKAVPLAMVASAEVEMEMDTLEMLSVVQFPTRTLLAAALLLLIRPSQPASVSLLKGSSWFIDRKLENWLRPHQIETVLTNLDRAPMWVLPSYRIQVTNASDCAHVAVHTKEILRKYEYASNPSYRNVGTQLKKLKANCSETKMQLERYT